jgi:hypothetical protein
LGQLLRVEHVEHRRGRGHADRVAAERVEIPHRGAEVREHLAADHDSRDEQAVAHRLAHDDDVRVQAMPLVAPQVAAGAAEAGLHLVGDVQPARRAHHVLDRLQEAGRVWPHAVGGQQRVQTFPATKT